MCAEAPIVFGYDLMEDIELLLDLPQFLDELLLVGGYLVLEVHILLAYCVHIILRYDSIDVLY
jgi:hypothetical protein